MGEEDVVEEVKGVDEVGVRVACRGARSGGDRSILFIGIRMLCVLFTRGYGDHFPPHESWKAMDVMSCRCTCRVDEDTYVGRCEVAAVRNPEGKLRKPDKIWNPSDSRNKSSS
jgi:hypothetical protein